MSRTDTVPFSRIFVTAPGHAEPLLADEVREILGPDGPPVSESSGGVYVEAGLAEAYRLCLWSRIAGRVLGEIATDVAPDREALYRAASAVPYERYMALERTFAVSGHVSHGAFRDSRLPFLVVKDAVADRFRERLGRRPSVDTDAPDVRFFLHLTTQRMRLYIDLSGESLHRRGYRRRSTDAPLRENTAAAVLRRAGWTAAVAAWRAGETPVPFLADPMCGSGTIPIEAAMVALDTAPGMARERFGFEQLLVHDAESWRRMGTAARERAVAGATAWRESGGRIWASDIDETAVSAAAENAVAAGVSQGLRVESADFSRLARGALLGARNRDYDPDAPFPGFVVTNPPYGRRIRGRGAGSGDAHERLGRWMARELRGFRAAVLAESKEQARGLGLRADRVYALFNGNLDIVLALLSLDESNRFRSPGDAPTDETSGTAMLGNRFRRNRRGLKRYLAREDVTCYRLYDADIPQYAAAVDVYEDENAILRAVVQEYAPPSTVDETAAARRFDELLETVRTFLDIPQGRLFSRERRRQRGPSQYGRAPDASSKLAVVVEDGLRFEVNFTDYLDVGLFLDHRLVRRRIRESAADARFLNLFAYTCSATVHAAAGGAARTVSVDSSRPYLAWARRNLELNGFAASERHELVRGDALGYLTRTDGEFDLMLIDPPSFSNSKSRDRDFDIQRDHVALLEAAVSRLSRRGRIIFSTNLRGFALSDAVMTFAAVSDISAETLPPDFARREKNRRVFELSLRGAS